MNNKIEELYLAEYVRLQVIRLDVYDAADKAPDLVIDAVDAVGFLLAHGRLLNQLLNSAVYLEQDLQESQDLVEVLKERVMFLEEQLDTYQGPNKA